ncbi:proline-rich nuclear receptor coactivator 2 [Malaya genurostris]|uniref:proline-rich nuclear receptor coactivator 2 n=1 Tax=Malaya genurostris TaxID=325434 RepID=UPI0026F39AE7|nr:proline-rich nuclear receptor coactivator 2 [Malaya genurostris]XP_058455696.1 proline-rich nuclear receptor coactivator 2 [Malaya genurostris]
MTNSHNRSGRNGNNAERYFINHSPQQWTGGSGKRNNATGNNGGSGNRGQKSPSSTYFRSISTSNAIPIVKSTSPIGSKSTNHYSTSSPSGRSHSFNFNAGYQRSSPGGNSFNASLGSYPGTLPGSPPNFSHFAGSKCYDAPAPTALPKPPVHWTSSSAAPSISTVASALNTSKTSTSKPTSASVITARNVSGKTPSTASSSSPRVKAKSVKPAMSCAAAAAKANRNVDFTNNLKTILNVQA